MKLLYLVINIFFIVNLYSETLHISFGQPTDSLIFQNTKKALNLTFKNIDGYDSELIYLPDKRATMNLKLGKTDGDAGRTSDVYLDSQNVIRINVPLLKIPYGIFTTQKTMVFENIFLYNIVIQRGNVAALGFVTKNNLNYMEVNLVENAFEMLTNGRADIFITSLTYKYLIKNYYQRNEKLHYIEVPLFYEDIFLYINKKHENLEEILYKELKYLTDSGIISKIFSNTSE